MRTALVAALWSCLLGVLSGLGVTPEPPAYPAVQWQAFPRAIVTAVIDGDTLELELPSAGLTVQADLAGAGGPGLRQPFGAEAAFFTRSLALGEAVRVQWTDNGQPDDRGRRSAVIYREPDGLCLNLELVRAGLARAESGAGELDSVLSAYTQRAEALGRGWVGGGEPAFVPQPVPAAVDPSSAEPPGSEPAETADAPAQTPIEKVFVTKSGSKYHRSTCRFVSGASSELALADAKARYQPCRVCKPDE